MLSKIKMATLIMASLAVLLTACTSQTSVSEPTPLPEAAIPVISDEPPIRIGVLSIRSAVATNTQYSPIFNYLTETLGRSFELVPVEFDAIFRTVETGDLDFMLANPLTSAQLQRLYSTTLLTTISRPDTETQFGGLIITRNDGEITTIDDMQGKKATCVNFETGAGGCLFQVFHLLEQNFDPFTEFSSFVENPSQDNIVLGVLNGTYDIGFIRTGQLERMVRDEMIFSFDELFVIDRVESDFFYPHTTILYPEWALAALEDTDADLSQLVQTALLDMPSDYLGLAESRIIGFEEASDYSSVEELIVTLEIFTWDITTDSD